jgi:hypothetical protein
MTKTLKTSTAKPKASAKAAPAAPARKTKATTAVTANKVGNTRAGKKPAAPVVPAPPQPTGSKQSQLIEMLKAPSGASIERMVALTGWQAHTVRGTISGVLRKRLGLKVVCGGEAGSRAYRIVAA